VTDGRAAVAAEWEARNPESPDEIARFYRESVRLADDLADWHQTPERQALTRALVDFMRSHGLQSQNVLDVGAGRGEDLRALVTSGVTFNCYLWAVEPNADLRAHMAVNVLHRNHLAETLADVPADFEPKLTICIDVLEHVTNPQAFLDDVLKRIPIGGYLAECTGTWDCETPLHLPQNRGWRPMGQILRAGFQPVAQTGRLTFFQRRGQSAYPSQSVLLCAWRGVTTGSLQSLWQLCRQGFGNTTYNPDVPVYDLMIRAGDANIGRARSIIVSDWWRDRADDVFIMVDDDIRFVPEHANRLIALAREKRSVVCAPYATKGGAHFACQLFPQQEVQFGNPEPVKIRYAATGFMAVHRSVIDAMIPTLTLCHPDEVWAFWPMFQEFIATYQEPRWPGDPGKQEYLSEDFAFSARARALGFDIWMEPSLNLIHEGAKDYTFMDVVARLQAGETKYMHVIGEPVARELAEVGA
jgi:hypothetical protein